MYGIVRGIPKPENLPERRPGSKYPLSEMAVDDSFVVPYGDMKEGETPEKFRSRIYQSCRNYALRALSTESGEKRQFTAALMTEHDKTSEKRYVAGDVVVWRDK